MLVQADMDDAGPRQARSAVERTCIVTRAVKPVGELIRFVVAPDGAVVPDLKRRLPGRGVWVTATRTAVDQAVKRKGFSRAFKREVRAPAGLPAEVEGLLQRAALDALAMVHKAGRAALGFARTEKELTQGPVVAVLQAADGSADSARKIAAAAARRQAGENGAAIPIIATFTTAQLDLALGRSNVVHAALLAGPASNGFLARCQSLERYRTLDPGGRGAG